MVTVVLSFPPAGWIVTEPNAGELTSAGSTMSSHTALTVTGNPASIDMGVTSKIVDAVAGAAPRSKTDVKIIPARAAEARVQRRTAVRGRPAVDEPDVAASGIR